MKRYYKIMGCVMVIITLAILTGLIIMVVNQFKDGEAAWPIIKTFLNMLATLTVGSALANLFYSHACVIEKTYDDDFYSCDIDE